MAANATKITYNEGSAPSTPAASKVVTYAKSDGLMYSKDDAGTETLMSGGAGGGAVATDAIWDAKGDLAGGTGANTASKLTVGSNGQVLTADSTQTTGLIWATPSAGSAWTSTLSSETGASFANWANDIASHWSSNGTQFICNPGTGNTGKARLTTALFRLPARIDCDMYFDSTGTSEAGGSACLIGIGSSSNPSRGPAGGLRMVSNNPAANGQAYIEEQGQTGYNLATSTFALDTYIPVRIDIAASQTVTVTKSGTVIASESWNQNTGPYVLGSLIMIAYQAKVRIRNIVLYQL